MSTNTHTLIAIAAVGEKTRALGRSNDLIWKLPSDLKHFKDTTKGHPIIMGYKTWESLPPYARPLPNRTNIVLSRTCPERVSEYECAESPEDALKKAKNAHGNEQIFVVGGGQIYALFLPLCDELNLTLVYEDTETSADTFFPEYTDLFTEVSRTEHTENDVRFAFTRWVKKVA